MKWIWIGAFMILCVACNQTQKTENQGNQADSVDVWNSNEVKLSLPQQLDLLSDSVKKCWKRLYEEDSMKLVYVGSWIQQIYNEDVIKKYDKKIMSDISKKLSDVKAVRYNQQTVASEQVLDKYDAETTILVKLLSQFAESTQDFAKDVRLNELHSEIMTLENNDLVRRKDYAIAAKTFNALLENQKQAIQNLSEQYKRLRPVPVVARMNN